jgi:hypothetical protein
MGRFSGTRINSVTIEGLSGGGEPGEEAAMVMRPTVRPRRLGKNGDDIFTPHLESGEVEKPKKRGRRPSHTEHWTKVTVVLFDRQIVFLDRLGADIRAASGVAISRAHVIRALIDALSESDLDLTGTRSEADLKAILTARLGRYRV